MIVGLIVVGLFPLLRLFIANQGNTLTHAVCWAVAAWLAWGGALAFGNPDETGMDAGRYCALCLTGCAGVAVLGARRPHVAAWNFVVLGLFVVMMLPLVEALILGTHSLDGLRIFFLTATIAVGILNYLPTRFALAAFLLLIIMGGEIALLYAPAWFPGQGEVFVLHVSLLTIPWIAWMCLWKRDHNRTTIDQLWLAFRDRWGLFWSQRVRDQFNQAAENAGLRVKLSWRGLVVSAVEMPPTKEEEARILQTLAATMQRFMTHGI